MTTHHSADARTAFIAMYIAQCANPQAGMRFTRATPSQQRGERKGEKVLLGPFSAQGRTIYNANAYPKAGTGGDREGKSDALWELERIDADEERQRRHWGQFLMAARGDFEESSSSRETTPTDPSEADRAEEMFALYIRDDI
ncbi:hypothetical protein L210DRAFT_3528572 [Boletus edulis BED1]|uniref:Uncharacterized protein n=1 Tax=Boletus edulis BED1 TaxID=1328754 RepID=A0AAD4C1Y9_BOLED|nr:hypothetical protein L210DRAFT_3528572 [Boletus edulis BED1]